MGTVASFNVTVRDFSPDGLRQSRLPFDKEKTSLVGWAGSHFDWLVGPD